MESDRNCTVFALGGGGRWGAVQIGMLRALVDHGISPSAIVGTSIGAINGAVFASDPEGLGITRLERLWERVAESGIGGSTLSRAYNAVRWGAGVYPHEPLQRYLEDALGARTFGDLHIPFACVAASIEHATERWFSEGPLVPALMASSAVPGIYPPFNLNGEHFYDGGLVNSVPVDRAIAMGATEVYVLQVGRIEHGLAPPKRLHESALVAFEIARRHRLATLLETPPPGVAMHVLPSGSPVRYKDPKQLRFSNLGDLKEMIEVARRASKAYLEHLGARS